MALSESTTALHSTLGRLQLHAVPAIGKPRSEDLVNAAGSAAWLFDGAAHDDPEACRDHDPAWFVNHLSHELEHSFERRPDADLRHVLADAIATLASFHAATCSHARLGHGPSATVVIVRRRRRALDYLVLGDSTLLVETRDGLVHSHSDTRLANVKPDIRREIRSALVLGGGYDSTHRERLRRLRATERLARNRDTGFWIASDDPHAAHHSVVGTYALDAVPLGASRVALISDGIGRAVTHLNVFDDCRALFLAMFHQGIPRCIDRIRHAELDDPAGERFPRSARSDDAAAITCDLFP